MSLSVWEHITADHYISGNSKLSQLYPIVIRLIAKTKIANIIGH